MSGNGSNYPKSDDSHLKSDNNVRNGTKKFKIERKCPKSDGCAQKRTEGSEIGQTWTKLPEIWRNSLKLGGEFLPISRRRFFSVESVIILKPDESNLFFSWKVHVRKSRLYVTLLLFHRKPQQQQCFACWTVQWPLNSFRVQSLNTQHRTWFITALIGTLCFYDTQR